jgi:hypothetical protein
VAVHSRNGAPYDYHRSLYTFRVKSRVKDVGVYRPRHRWEFRGDALRIRAQGSGLKAQDGEAAHGHMRAQGREE